MGTGIRSSGTALHKKSFNKNNLGGGGRAERVGSVASDIEIDILIRLLKGKMISTGSTCIIALESGVLVALFGNEKIGVVINADDFLGSGAGQSLPIPIEITSFDPATRIAKGSPL